jgi:hypothetical protein
LPHFAFDDFNEASLQLVGWLEGRVSAVVGEPPRAETER